MLFIPSLRISYSQMISMVITSIILVTLCSGITSAVIEKTGTNLSITISPDEPGIGDPFYVTGILASDDNKPLGNKKIILQSSETSSDSDEKFENLKTEVTARDGSFSFFRAETAKPEFIRVFFSGNDQYEKTTSNVISIRGAGTDNPLVQTNLTGSIKINTHPEGAQIFIDDVYRGVTPNTIAKLPEGKHILKIIKPGYLNETTETFVTSKIDNSYDYSLKKNE